jgi:hypothetical protein
MKYHQPLLPVSWSRRTMQDKDGTKLTQPIRQGEGKGVDSRLSAVSSAAWRSQLPPEC